MKIHHLNCGTMKPLGGRFIVGAQPGLPCPCMVCHVLVVELADRLVLVDSGLGLDDVRKVNSRLPAPFRATVRPVLRESETAVRQVEALGYQASDVTDVILTHLDADHAGGLSDFPRASLHVLGGEWDDATNGRDPRYAPSQLGHLATSSVHQYQPTGEAWFGFAAARELTGLPPELLLVAVPGHSRAHAAVAVQRPDGRVMLHAGDAYFHRGALTEGEKRPLGLRLFTSLIATDRRRFAENRERLAELASREDASVDMVSAHDPSELLAYNASALAG